MSTDPALLWNASKPLPPKPQAGEILFEFVVGELRDHGVYGVEAQFFQNEEFFTSRRFDSRLDPTRAPREMAISWAEQERNAVERLDA